MFDMSLCSQTFKLILSPKYQREDGERKKEKKRD